MLYDKFLALCNEKGISPSTAANQMGISKTLLSKWKRREQVYPSARVLSIMQDYFGVPPSEIIESCAVPESEPLDVVAGQRLKMLRKAAGMTQETLADNLKISSKRIGPMENGTTPIPSDLVSRLALLFSVDVQYFTERHPSNNDTFKAKSIGQMISYKRTSLGLSQEDLAAQANITTEQINQWEEGRFSPADKEAIDRLAHALHISSQIINRFFCCINNPGGE